MQRLISRTVLAAVLLGFVASVVDAQEATLGFYIVPQVGTGVFTDPFRPAYIGDMGVNYSAMPYGLDPTMLVGAQLTPAQHTFVTSQSDVYAVPPLDDAVGGNPVLNQMRNKLEQRSIPADWITATTTNRQVLGRIGRVCQILQRMQGRHNKRMFEAGVTLDSALTQTLLDQLVDVGQSFGFDTSGLNLTLDVRTALLLLGDQFGPVFLAGETF